MGQREEYHPWIIVFNLFVGEMERPVLPQVVGEDRGFLIGSGPEGRGTWRVFRGPGPERFPLEETR